MRVQGIEYELRGGITFGVDFQCGGVRRLIEAEAIRQVLRDTMELHTFRIALSDL